MQPIPMIHSILQALLTISESCSFLNSGLSVTWSLPMLPSVVPGFGGATVLPSFLKKND